ncbi:MAG: hypothetical protein ING33_02685 [Rhodocyclaceae bacterium]|nr:hypothetical protein [Rhodocyclaceae bacterium]MCA3024867.1 hypothetical protein [Rhodocyclaceae bacterium]MCA3032176.1 hypothetical protein [Rhodocyclaceae bacterium]MCA3034107.1 hypothetical protein [Rhodocyclaceae bacterium]MCA3035878.1 hypothetical protein [Rhodocyclaceae bacterium]
MKLFGSIESNSPAEEVIPRALAEVTLCAAPDELIAMADFLRHCAAEMIRMGATYDHIHLSDHLKQFRNSPHFVVHRE